MKTLPNYFTLALVAVFLAPAYAEDKLPTGQHVMDQFVKSIGGKQALSRIKNTATTGTIAISSMGQGNMKFTQYATAPAKVLMRLEMEPMGTMEQGTDGNLAWMTTPMGTQLLTGPIEQAMKRDAVFQPDLNWRDLYKDVKCVDEVEFEGIGCFKLLQTTPQGDVVTAYFERDTWLQRGLERTTVVGTGQNADETQVLKGYKEVDGVLYAHKTIKTVSMGTMKQEMTITIETIECNVDMPADKFTPPDAALEQAKAELDSEGNDKSE